MKGKTNLIATKLARTADELINHPGLSCELKVRPTCTIYTLIPVFKVYFDPYSGRKASDNEELHLTNARQVYTAAGYKCSPFRTLSNGLMGFFVLREEAN